MAIEIANRLREYKCHKTVRAAEIVKVQKHDTGTGTLTLLVGRQGDGEITVEIQVTSAYMQKHQPEEGGVYVLYKDGYESYSPAEPFEEGYSPAPEGFVGRLLAEQEELIVRTLKLRTFIASSPVFIALAPRDKELLRAQLTTMEQYLVILDERISRQRGEPQPEHSSYAGQNPILQFFSSSHLPDKLRAVSSPLGLVAGTMDGLLPNSAEKSAGLRKLLEAKDCFVRAAL